MSNIFDLYTPQQIREMYFEDEWPNDYEECIYDLVCNILYANATEEEIKAAEIEVINGWTYDQEDDHGYLMGEFIGKNDVEYTDKGPQLLLFDMNEE